MASPAPSSAPQRKGLILGLLAMAQFVVVLDASIVNVALPSIGKDLDFSQDNLAWVVNAYTLTFGGFLLLGGRLADLLGRRRIFMSGVVLFSIASLAGGFATSEIQLIAARAVQGLGAALMSPAALSIVTNTFAEGAERNKALGVWGAVAGSGGAIGVLLGGVLTDTLGWQWVLWVNVPIGVIVALAAPRIVPESRRETEGPRRFDVAGALTVTVGLSVLVYALVDANSAGWESTQTLALLGVAVLLLAGFVFIELRNRAPLVPFSFFQNRTATGANVIGLLTGASLFSMFFFISLYLQQVLGYSPLKAGFAYLPLGLSIILAAGIASQLVTRIGFKPVMVTGLLLIAAGLVWFAQVSPDGSFVVNVLPASLLAAVGLGFVFVSVTIAAVSGVAPNEAGLASGLINTSQQVGGAVGLAVLAAIANGVTDDRLASATGRPDVPAALTDGFQAAFITGAGFAVVGAVLAMVLIKSKDSRDHAEAARAGAAEPAAAAA